MASKHTTFASRSSAHQSHDRRDMPLVERDGGGQRTQWSLLRRPRTSHYTLYSNCRNVLDLQMSWGRFFLHGRRLIFVPHLGGRRENLKLTRQLLLTRSSAFGFYGKNMDTEASSHTSSNLDNHSLVLFAVLWAWRSPLWFRRTSAIGSLQNVPASLPQVLFLCFVGRNAWFRRVRCAVAMRDTNP